MTEEKIDQKEKIDQDIQVIQWVKNFDLLFTRYSLFLDHQKLNFEQIVACNILVKISDLLVKFSDLPQHQMKDFLDHFYEKMRDFGIVLTPNEKIRHLFRILQEYGIISAGMVKRLSIDRGISSKTSARIYLKRLERAGIICRYSTEPLEKIEKPLANLKLTELYGFNDLPESAYKNAIDFYSLKTEEGHDKEKIKAQIRRDKKRLIHKVDEPDEADRPTSKILNPAQIKDTIENYQRSLAALSMAGFTSSEREYYRPIYEKKIHNLKERLKEIERKELEA